MRKYSSLIISDIFDSIDLQVLFNVTFLEPSEKLFFSNNHSVEGGSFYEFEMSIDKAENCVLSRFASKFS